MAADREKEREVAQHRNIVEPVLGWSQSDPDRVAVVYKDDVLTYRQLDELSRRIARVFLKHGVKSGDRVAYLLPNRPELIAVYVAVQRIGAVAVPLNYRLIPREIAFLVNSVEASLLLFDQRFLEAVRAAKDELGAGVGLISVGACTEFSERLYDMEERMGTAQLELYVDGGPSRIQFTGGSTGVPKGVVRSHAADLCEIAAVSASNGMNELEHPVALVQCPLEHHGGHSWFASCLAIGATVVVCGKFEPDKIYAQIEEHKATHVILLPPVTYLRLVQDGHPQDYDLSSVRIIQSAAGGITPEIVNAIFDAFPNADINYGWGQSESGVGTSMRMTREMYSAKDPKLTSIGTPMDTLEIKIVDDDFNELACGQTGEAVVRTPAAMDGYWGQSQLTKAAFTKGWLHTGDVMTIDKDGYCYLRGRKRDIIKSGGENVFMGEVQTAILRIPEVADCVVFGVPDPLMGEAVAAVVQPVKGSWITAAQVQDACKSFIASYKKPRYIEFTDDLGRDDAGKVRMQSIIEYFYTRRQETALS